MNGPTAADSPFAARSAQQLIDRQPRQLPLDVPQRHVDRGDRGHRARDDHAHGGVLERQRERQLADEVVEALLGLLLGPAA